jgi:hypothetical protein
MDGGPGTRKDCRKAADDDVVNAAVTNVGLYIAGVESGNPIGGTRRRRERDAAEGVN